MSKKPKKQNILMDFKLNKTIGYCFEEKLEVF